MVAVSSVDGIKYGFGLLGYLLAVVVAGGVLILIGTGFSPGPYSAGNPVLVMVFVLAGMAIIYAGGLGLLYKVIADGVHVGTVAAERGGPAGGQSRDFGQSPGFGQPAGDQAQVAGRQAPSGQSSVGGQPSAAGRSQGGHQQQQGNVDGNSGQDTGDRDTDVQERSSTSDEDDQAEN